MLVSIPFVSIDPFIGKLGVFHIHQGKIEKNNQLFIGDSRKPFKVGRLLKLQGKEHIEVESGISGDICAVAKADEIQFDSVLHDSHDEDHIHLRSIEFPAPMYGLAIETKSRGDEQKIFDTLHKSQTEDQSFKIEHSASLNETVIKGFGELHLRIILDRLRDRYHVEVNARPPRIAYVETITVKTEGHHRHKKQTGGAGQFGEVFLKIEPLSRGEGFEFVDKVVGGVIPKQFIPAVEKGILQVLAEEAITGYPVQDIRAIVYDGKHHSVDSKEIVFVSADKKAFLEAVHKAKPVVMEPIVEISVNSPNESMGDIATDLSGKRGRISNASSMSGGFTITTGLVHLSELDNYQPQLKSITEGTGSYSISLSHYDPVPAKTQQELKTEFKPVQEE